MSAKAAWGTNKKYVIGMNRTAALGKR